jgi:hypothetical protein
MAKVKAKVLCFVANGLREPGDVFEYEGRRNSNLEYLEEATVELDTKTPEAPTRRLRKGKLTETSVTE